MKKFKNIYLVLCASMFATAFPVMTLAQNTTVENNLSDSSNNEIVFVEQNFETENNNDKTTNESSKSTKMLFEKFYTAHILNKKGEAKLLKNPHFIDAIFSGEEKAKSAGNALGLNVLQTARKIIVTDKEIIRGSCWDWPNAVFNRAGFTIKQRKQLFKGKYDTPPYADIDMFQAGDWLHFVNLSYHNSAHSAIFVDWLDREKNIALLASYGGENRNHPARYRAYDVSQV